MDRIERLKKREVPQDGAAAETAVAAGACAKRPKVQDVVDTLQADHSGDSDDDEEELAMDWRAKRTK